MARSVGTSKIIYWKPFLTKVILRTFFLSGFCNLKNMDYDKLLDEIQHTGAKTVAWKHQLIQRREIEMIHRRGLKVWVYTVDETSRAAELIRDGIDGLITNRPQAIKKLLSQAQQ